MPTKIEWADEVWNPITGCEKISPACDHCYAERFARRLAGRCGYPNKGAFTPGLVHEEAFNKPFAWKKPRRIFTVSMGDLFHPAVKPGDVARVFDVIRQCPQHTFMILTKRPKLAAQVLGGRLGYTPLTALNNVWFGITAENSQWAGIRFEALPILRELFPVLFLSCEPLLGPIFPPTMPEIDWIIAGGESGKGARPSHPGWFKLLRDHCEGSQTPFFFKRWGEWRPIEPGETPENDFNFCAIGPSGELYNYWGDSGKTPLAKVVWNRIPNGFQIMKRGGGNSRLLFGNEYSQFPEISK